MKVKICKQVYDQFDDESRADLTEIACDCIVDGCAQDDCTCCQGGGVVYEFVISQEQSAAIENNLRSQGVPLGKSGTN